MDNPELDPGLHAAALRGLARLNRLSGIGRTVWRSLLPYAGGGPCTVLDVAAGSGDLVVRLASRAMRCGAPFHFTACDVSGIACSAVVERAEAAGVGVEAVRLDALHGDLLPHDVVMCHLFLHHLDEQDIISLLKRMKRAARRGVLISDLTRTRLGYGLAWIASRTVTGSSVVHTDALLSVRAALTPVELAGLAGRAGLVDACIRRVWPERMMLSWRADP